MMIRLLSGFANYISERHSRGKVAELKAPLKFHDLILDNNLPLGGQSDPFIDLILSEHSSKLVQWFTETVFQGDAGQ
jgi:hypothetical protein